jgi:hypothetical protein
MAPSTRLGAILQLDQVSYERMAKNFLSCPNFNRLPCLLPVSQSHSRSMM